MATAKDFYRRSRAIIGMIGLALGLLVVVVAPLRNEVRSWFTEPVNDARERVEQKINPTFVPVRPVGVTASAENSRHPASLAFDQGSNTYWSARWTAGAQPRLVVTFAQPVDLSRLIVTSGAGKSFVKVNRPAVLHLVYSTRTSETFQITDSAVPATFTLGKGDGVTRIEIIIRGIHPAQKSRSVALAELEFFAKQ